MRRWSLLAQDLKVALSDRFLGLTRLSPRRPLHRQCNGRRLFNDSDSSIEPAEARFLTKCSYPRHRNTTLQATCSAFIQRYKDSVSSDLDNENDNLELYGRVTAKRTAGSRLVFLDINQNGQRLQALCNLRVLPGISQEAFKAAFHELQRGDIVRLNGKPHKTSTGELSLLLSILPEVVAPCLHTLPAELKDPDTRIRNRSADFLVNPQSKHLLQARSSIIQYMRQFFLDDNQLEIQTPILAEATGGAVARPFVTTATEFSEKKISLRIAPELWLKRLVVGGFDRIFEIGPAFRNEGIDLTHNPEFMICEFYRAYTDLNALMQLTEDLVNGLARHLEVEIKTTLSSLSMPGINFDAPFQRLDFIPQIEKALKHPLPNLAEPGTQEQLIEIFDNHSIPLPATASLPQLLDKLCATFLEPQCSKPTFIVHHPECLSPLSKSFEHPSIKGQRVAARAELFIQGKELANMYEEENSPYEQRRKFVEQLEYRGGRDLGIDEKYIDALRWGLPPVGGWGCGIERLCMIMTGSSRIGDVLSFGTLKNVIARSTSTL